MKEYVPPKIINYFTEPQSIIPIGAAAAAQVTAGVASGVVLGFLAGRRDIYKGPNKGLMPMDMISPTDG